MIRKMLLMSIKPVYIQKIFEGEKTVELRRTRPKLSQGDLIVFYASSPQRAIRGAATVGRIIEGTPAEIWVSNSAKIGITQRDYDAYFSGSKKAFGIVLETVWAYANPIGIDAMRGLFDNFMPPQSFRYLSMEEFKVVETLEKIHALTEERPPYFNKQRRYPCIPSEANVVAKSDYSHSRKGGETKS
jgi:predicted transcriptional regulator